jgi:hypothetical protein
LLHSYSTFPQGQRQILTKIHRQRDIQSGRQTDRQTDRQAGRQAGRQTDRQTNTDIHMPFHPYNDKQTF